MVEILNEIREGIRELKRMQKFNMRVIIGTKEIASMMNTTPGNLRLNFKKYKAMGYPLKKDGRLTVALKDELEQFIRDRFAKL